MLTGGRPDEAQGGGSAPAEPADDMAAGIRAMVDSWPPLSEEQRQRLALLLRPAVIRADTD